MQAAIEAISIAIREGFNSLRIHTDSKYVIKGAKSWIKNWENNNWLTSDGESVVSKEKWMELNDVMRSFEGNYGLLSWKYVRAHRGNFGNREADRLAREAARSASNREDFEDTSDDEDSGTVSFKVRSRSGNTYKFKLDKGDSFKFTDKDRGFIYYENL